MTMFLVLAVSAFVFTSADNEFKCGDYEKCDRTLQVMLEDARTDDERAEVLWRLARVHLMLGEAADDTGAKRAHFSKGITYASKGIEYDPKNVQCYMWHCANVGRECQTHSLIEQAAAVPDMTRDLTTILDKLGDLSCSAAWQALSEMYWHHPFKSDESAVNFARKAAVCIPEDELRLSTYIYVSELLTKRDWSADKRASEAKSNSARFRRKYESNIEKYSYYDGAGEIMPWSDSDITGISDREEAQEILRYAERKYRQCQSPTAVDKDDFKKLMKIINR